MSVLTYLRGLVQREHGLERLPSPGLDRRGFLKLLAGSAAVAAAAPMLDLEALVWTPQPMIVVPEVGGVFPITSSWIARESLKVLERNLAMVKLVNRQYDDNYVIGSQHQFSVDIEARAFEKMTRPQARRLLVEPMAQGLADRAAFEGIEVLAPLPLPTLGAVTGAVATKGNLSVRVLEGYSVLDAEHRIRMDVLGGGK